jgi:hypothetical protein
MAIRAAVTRWHAGDPAFPVYKREDLMLCGTPERRLARGLCMTWSLDRCVPAIVMAIGAAGPAR